MRALLFTTLVFAATTAAQIPPREDGCGMKPVCTASCEVPKCPESSDPRQCTRQISVPFGNILRFTDQGCEAARVSQDALFKMEKADCDRRVQQVVSACESDRAKCIDIAAACSTIKARQAAVARPFKVLWVDDHPENNKLEHLALEKLGAHITYATTTHDALYKFRTTEFDVVISDFSRKGDPRAGYTLLGELKTGQRRAPYIIYSADSSPERVAEARAQGALTQTNVPGELLNSVQRAVGSGAGK
jgi:CheY-like chemotaxis protein